MDILDSARAQSQAQAEEFRGAARVLQEEVQEARAAAATQQALLQVKLAEAKAALVSETTDLKQRLSASAKMRAPRARAQIYRAKIGTIRRATNGCRCI